jgi:photosystem II stability/assembly factor-like uncharacterized protein
MTTIALSHGGSTTYAPAAPAQRLLVGTGDGVAVLEREDARGEWRTVHHALPGRHVSAIVVPAPDLIVAGAFHDTVYASGDGGWTWERRGDGIEPAHVFSLAAVARGRGLRLYAGTEPAHLFSSDDTGATWREHPGLRAVPSVPRWMFPAPPHQAHVKHIVPDPLDPSVLYACIEQGALLRSRDGGASWEELAGVDEDVHFLVVHPRDTRRLFITGGNGCYASADGGATWEHRTTRTDPVGGYPDTLVQLPRDPDVMFMGAARGDPPVWRRTHTAQSRLCRSRDGGRTWQVLDGGFPRDEAAAVEAMSLVDCAGQVALFVGTTAGDVYASEDAGDSWRRIAAGLPPIAKFGHDRALQGA